MTCEVYCPQCGRAGVWVCQCVGVGVFFFSTFFFQKNISYFVVFLKNQNSKLKTTNYKLHTKNEKLKD